MSDGRERYVHPRACLWETAPRTVGRASELRAYVEQGLRHGIGNPEDGRVGPERGERRHCVDGFRSEVDIGAATKPPGSANGADGL
jgi:hypothetical protein